MDPKDFLLHAVLGVCGGGLSGLAGLGGGILLAPLLLYAPPALGCVPLDVREVSGLTVLTSLAATLLGARLHGERVDRRLSVPMGVSIALASFLGAGAAAFLPPRAVLAILCALATLGGFLVLIPVRSPGRRRSPAVGSAVAAGIGLLGGSAGQSGAFLLAPLLVTGMGIPPREAVGTCLAITAASAGAATLGKAVTGQVPWPLAPPLVAGSLLGTWLGTRVFPRVSTTTLRAILGGAILAGAARMAVGVLRGAPG